MNRKMVFYMTGQIVKLEAVLLVLPFLVSLCYLGTEGLKNPISFAITIGIALAVGYLLTFLCRSRKKEIFAKEGFIITALAWIILSAIGALPFVISGAIPNYIDAFFETVSGFTTTGASILTGAQIDALGLTSHGMMFWRSFTHWMGGMGVLVLIVAILPTVSGRTIHVLRAEMPGPTMGKLVPKLKDTAKILYLMYFVLTALEAIFLICGGMPVFDSVVHSLGTAGTGGFGIRADSIASYSPYCQWVITIFMALFGVNFNLYYLLLFRRMKGTLKSEELWTYIGLIVLSSSVIALNINANYPAVSDTIRTSAFQVASFITTTGYSTADVNSFPVISKTILLILMFVGGCAGSTAGGLKVSRVVLLFKTIRRAVRRMIHPRSVNVVKFEGKKVEDSTLTGIGIYFAVYCMLFIGLFLLISLDGFSIEANFSAAASTFNNIGPAYAEAAGGFFIYSPLSKILMSFAMLLGRLEIYPLLILFSVPAWKGN